MRLAFALLCTVASVAIHWQAWLGEALSGNGFAVHLATMLMTMLPNRPEPEGRWAQASQVLGGYSVTVFLAVWTMAFCFGNFTYLAVGISAAWLAVNGTSLLAELSRVKSHPPPLDEASRFMGNATLGAIAGTLAALPSAWGHPTLLILVAGLSATLSLLLDTRRRRGLDAAIGQLFTAFLGAFLASLWLTGLHFPSTPWQSLALGTAATLGCVISGPVLRWVFDKDYCRRLDHTTPSDRASAP